MHNINNYIPAYSKFQKVSPKYNEMNQVNSCIHQNYDNLGLFCVFFLLISIATFLLFFAETPNAVSLWWIPIYQMGLRLCAVQPS